MAAQVILRCVILFQGAAVLGTLINPQHLPGKSNFQNHCLASERPIQIKDPFDRRLAEDNKFIAMEWYQLVSPSTDGEAKETLLIQFLPNKTHVFREKFSVFEFWGLQIHNIGLEDSATYKAKLVHLSGGRDWSVNIVVSTPPVLKSEKLSVSRIVNEEGQSVTLSCGQFASLGSPPVPLVWRTENGTVLPANYKDGYIKLTVPLNEDTGKYFCHLNMSSMAAQCILDTEASRFSAVVATSSGPKSADVTSIIIGSVLGAFIIFVVIAVVVFIKMKRQPKSETYNAREQEKKHDAEVGRTNGISLIKNEEESPHGKSHKPIYKGVVSADSFMISKVSEGSSDLIFKKVNPQTASSKNTVYLNGDKSDLNGHRLQPQDKSIRVVKQEDDITRQKIENDKKKIGKVEANGFKGIENKLPNCALKNTNGITGNGHISNGTTGNRKTDNGVVTGHGTLV